jgi:ABC-2 type transport system permease protein
MLNLDADIRIIAISLSVMIALSVCSLSTGLGATFLDLKQQNPSAIVSGFGGTLNLACSLAILVAVIFPFGFVIYSQSAGMLESQAAERSLTLATIWSITVTVLATYIPMRVGYNSLKKRDF